MTTTSVLILLALFLGIISVLFVAHKMGYDIFSTSDDKNEYWLDTESDSWSNADDDGFYSDDD